MTFLIVIPCLDEEAYLPGLLEQLARENPEAKIVVADGGSTDASRRIVEEAASRNEHIVLLDNPERRQAAAINLAVKHYGEGMRWLIRIDAHCDYPEGYCRGLLESAQRTEGTTSVVVPMVSRGRTCFQKAAATAQNSVIGTGGSPHRHVGQGRFVDHGHHALMDMALFRQVHGYRTDMAHNEDAELDLRLLQAGGRIWLEPASAIFYYPRKTIGALFRQYWGYGRGRAWTRRLHRVPLKTRQMVPLLVPVAAVIVPLALIHPVFAAPLIGWAAAILMAGVLVGARAGGGCALFSGVAAATMHMAWGAGYLYETLIARRRWRRRREAGIDFE